MTVDLRVAPPASSPVVRARFCRQGRRDTVPELAVRRRLHARGVRYRVDVRPCPQTRARGDLVWKGRRLVVFIDGCFWHACPACGHLPTANAGWWTAKLAANVARDRRTDAVLTGLGWQVLRFWEHEDPDAVVDRICAELAADRIRPDGSVGRCG
ncbi:very short patch repair endonuclease [Modestobacter versicolor]|uniref:very short patch repair endonuclease n=1 Tax=Modestobacter versicolor TaxID=429133 RepID=UPI0034DE527C